MLTDDRTGIGGGALSNTFGGRDRLESMTVGTPTFTFKINALGQRVQKAKTGTTTDYHFDLAGHIIGEADDSTGNNLVEYVWMEGMMLAQIDSSGNIVYVHSSQVNAPQKITNPSRTLAWDYETEPFGETYATPTNTTPTNHRFPGQYADSEDTLSYNYMRDYDVSLGRYGEFDPMGLAAGLNGFGYAGQNPTQNIDPLGLAYGDAWDHRTYQYSLVIDAMAAEESGLQGLAGLTDTLTWGESQSYRQENGLEYADPCSAAYEGGELAGIATNIVAGGGLGLEAAGTEGAGLEFSHWIPSRMGGPRSLWNGNYVSDVDHALSDPYRYNFMPKAWKESNDLPGPLTQQWNRIPNVYKGGAAGAAVGASAANSGCGCK